jgi:hypothetical protein
VTIKDILNQAQHTSLAIVLRLLDGDLHRVAANPTLFENNRHRINYLELCEDGWLIGSGMAESGAKHDVLTKYNNRLTIHTTGILAMLVVISPVTG